MNTAIALAIASDFEEMWDTVDSYYGWLTYDEARTLYNYTRLLAPFSRAVEIGSAAGKSSAVLASSLATKHSLLICVDPFYPIIDAKGETQQDSRRAPTEFIPNVKEYQNCQLMIMESEWARTWVNLPIDFLYIDGEHTEKAVQLDCDLWLPLLSKGKTVMFHDYAGSFPDVKKVVDARTDIEVIKVVDRIAIAKKL